MVKRLPDPADLARLEGVATRAFGAEPATVVAVPGADIGLRLLPYLTGAKDVAIVAPTYSGHRAAWMIAGASVRELHRAEVGRCDAAALVLVNPNNPDGAVSYPQKRDGWLIVDESSFAELQPEVSLAGEIESRTIVLRSFGKFYGLPGLRLGFVVAHAHVASRLREMIGDWPVSAGAVAIGTAAYADTAWREQSLERLRKDAARLDRILQRAGLLVRGGTALFRLVEAQNAPALFRRLASAGILVRAFAERPTWLRFGLPGRGEWKRLEAALA